MSFESLLNRTVSIVPMDQVSTDELGNEVLGPGTPITDVPARREQLTAAEQIIDRDQQTETVRYYLPAGTAINGRDRIIDGDQTFEVLGPPDVVADSNLDHHIELRAYRIEG